MQILALVAGTNDPSNADTLCDAFLAGVREAFPGCAINKLRLKDLQIKHFETEYYHPQCSSEDDFCKLQEYAEGSDGIVIATPVWNFSVPAHLKNVIDRMGAFCLDENTRTKGILPGTPAYFLFTGGAPAAAWKGLMRFTTSHLPESLRYYGASIIGKFYEGRCTKGKGVFGLVIDSRLSVLKKARSRGKAFGNIVAEFSKTGRLPLRYKVMRTVYSFGQRIAAKI
jgi:multimeric flavodoxin WrbA